MTAKYLCVCLLLAAFLAGCAPTVGVGGDGLVSMPQLEGDAATGEILRLEVDEDNIRQVLENTPRPQQFIWESTVTYYSGEHTRTQVNKITVSNGKMRLESWVNGSRTALYIVKEGQLYSFGSSNTSYYQRTWSGSCDELMAIGQIQDFLPIRQEDILESKIRSNENGNQLCLTVADPELGLREQYVFSMDSGIPLSVESTIDGEKSYTMETTLWDTQTVPEQSVFEIPQGSYKLG